MPYHELGSGISSQILHLAKTLFKLDMILQNAQINYIADNFRCFITKNFANFVIFALVYHVIAINFLLQI